MLSTYQPYHAVRKNSSRSVSARVQPFAPRVLANDIAAKSLSSDLNDPALGPSCQLIVLVLLQNN